MLPQPQRLHTASDFRKVRGRGRQWRSVSFLAFILPSSTPRLGVIVSAKIGKAVIRKRASRILRGGYQAQQSALNNKDIVLIARPMIKGRTAGQIAEELERMARTIH